MNLLDTYKAPKVYHPSKDRLDLSLRKMSVRQYNADDYIPTMKEVEIMKKDLKKYSHFIVWLYRTTNQTETEVYQELKRLVEIMCGEEYL